MGRKSFRNWLKPELPPHLREEFILLAAQHLRGQSQLLFSGFILSLPMVILARVEAAPAWVGIGLPILILIFSLAGLWAVRSPPGDTTRALRLMRLGMVCLFRRGCDG